jgi:hypothetical protein
MSALYWCYSCTVLYVVGSRFVIVSTWTAYYLHIILMNWPHVFPMGKRWCIIILVLSLWVISPSGFYVSAPSHIPQEVWFIDVGTVPLLKFFPHHGAILTLKHKGTNKRILIYELKITFIVNIIFIFLFFWAKLFGSSERETGPSTGRSCIQDPSLE